MNVAGVLQEHPCHLDFDDTQITGRAGIAHLAFQRVYIIACHRQAVVAGMTQRIQQGGTAGGVDFIVAGPDTLEIMGAVEFGNAFVARSGFRHGLFERSNLCARLLGRRGKKRAQGKRKENRSGHSLGCGTDSHRRKHQMSPEIFNFFKENYA